MTTGVGDEDDSEKCIPVIVAARSGYHLAWHKPCVTAPIMFSFAVLYATTADAAAASNVALLTDTAATKLPTLVTRAATC
jgi:hypothetical protein